MRVQTTAITTDKRMANPPKPEMLIAYFWKYDRFDQNSNEKLGFATTARSTSVHPGDCDNKRKPKTEI